MEYKKLTKKNYNLHCIRTDRFKAINVDVFFTKEVLKEDISYSNLLCDILVYTSKKYNTKNKFAIKLEELYSMKCNSNFFVRGNLECINLSTEFLNPKYTDKSMYRESLNFLKEVLLNPNTKDEEFDKTIFDLTKNNLKTRLEALKVNAFLKSELQYRSIMYAGTPSANSILGKIEDYDKISAKKLYTFYKKLFQDYKIDVVVIGNITEEDESIIFDEIDNVFKSVMPKPINELNPFIEHKSSHRVKKVIEEDNFKQSQLYMGYRMKEVSEHELHYVLKVYNVILGKMNNSILFEKLRGENSLCYFINSRANIYNPSVTINSGINKVNFEKSVKLIKECIVDMTNPKKIKPLFNFALKSINTILNDYYDDVYAIIDYYYKLEFENVESIEEEREKLSNVTIEDIVNFGKKLYLTTVYLLEGKSE